MTYGCTVREMACEVEGESRGNGGTEEKENILFAGEVEEDIVEGG